MIQEYYRMRLVHLGPTLTFEAGNRQETSSTSEEESSDNDTEIGYQNNFQEKHKVCKEHIAC